MTTTIIVTRHPDHENIYTYFVDGAMTHSPGDDIQIVDFDLGASDLNNRDEFNSWAKATTLAALDLEDPAAAAHVLARVHAELTTRFGT